MFIRDELALIDASPSDTLAALLSALDPTADVTEFNASLAQAEIPFAIEARPNR